jgi:hypothetical protein
MVSILDSFRRMSTKSDQAQVEVGKRARILVRLAILILSLFMLVFPTWIFVANLRMQVLVVSPPLGATFVAGLIGFFVLSNPSCRVER